VDGWVARDGVDVALARLAAAGVYVTFDEFKGKVPIERHGRTFAVRERDFDHPGLSAHYEVISGGTRSRGTAVGLNLGFIADVAVNTAFAYRVHGLLDAVHAIWAPSAGAAPMAVFAYLRLGLDFERWFSHWGGLPLKYRLGTSYVRWIARACGRRVPAIEYVDLAHARRVADWMADVLARGRRPCLLTYASSALRVAEAAVAAGLRLDGARFVVLGEPFTDAKRRVMEAAGARAIVRFAFTEAGIIGYGCLQPEEADDLHPFTDAFAIVRHRRAYREATVEPLLFTSLMPRAPKILLNVESGDTAEWVTTPCGCPFGHAGYDTRLRRIRSFEKFTGEGVSFVGVDVLRVLEETLPRAFGGSATHYQIIEEEADDGRVVLTLRIDPAWPARTRSRGRRVPRRTRGRPRSHAEDDGAVAPGREPSRRLRAAARHRTRQALAVPYAADGAPRLPAGLSVPCARQRYILRTLPAGGGTSWTATLPTTGSRSSRRAGTGTSSTRDATRSSRR
jgi:hypothetical protein